MRAALSALVAAAALAPVCAHAQDEPGQARLPDAIDQRSPTSTSADALPELDEDPLEVILEDELPPCGPRSEALYEEGFVALARGDRPQALRRFNEVLETCPEHPYAGELRRLAAFELERPPPPRGVLQRRREPGLRAAPPPQVAAVAPPSPRATLLSRAELVAVQSANGLLGGLLLCALAGCDDGRARAGAGIAGALAGGGVALALSARFTPGESAAINTGVIFGAWNGLALGVALDARYPDSTAIGTGLLLLGTGAGIGAALALDPEPGHVALASTFGIWSGVLAWWLMSAAGLESDDPSLFAVALAASDAGLAAGAILGRTTEVSREHLFLIDAGGLAGMLVAIGASFMIDSEPDTDLMAGLALLGTATGLGAAGWLTRDFDAPEDAGEPLDVLVSVRPAGRGLAVAVVF